MVKSIGFFLVSINFACHQDCNILWSLVNSLQTVLYFFKPLPVPKKKILTNISENSGQAVSQAFKANCFWPPYTLGSRLGQLFHQDEEPQPSRVGKAVAPSPSAQSQLFPCWPSAPAAKLRGLARAVACVLPPTYEEHLLVA